MRSRNWKWILAILLAVTILFSPVASSQNADATNANDSRNTGNTASDKPEISSSGTPANRTPEAGELVTVAQKEDFYRSILNISKPVVINSTSLDRLVSRNIEDGDNMEKIALTARLVVQEKRERLVNELIDMNKNFVKRFVLSARLSQASELVAKRQLERYLDNLKNKPKPRADLQKATVKNLFQKRISADELIAQLTGQA